MLRIIEGEEVVAPVAPRPADERFRGASVSAVARRNGVARSLLFRRRRPMDEGGMAIVRLIRLVATPEENHSGSISSNAHGPT